MSLPRLARRIDLVVERAANGVMDDWNRPADRTWSTLSTFRGDLQPQRTGEEEQAAINDGGPVVQRFVVYADPGVEVDEADRIRRATDDGLVYQVRRIRLVGEGTRLAHKAIDVELATRGTP